MTAIQCRTAKSSERTTTIGSSNISNGTTNDDDDSGLLCGCNLTSQCIRAVQRLDAVNKDNPMVVIKYLTEQQVLGFAKNYKSKCGIWACRLSELTGFKDFIKLTREDLARFFAFYNKGEIESDPKHHWKGTYNQALIHITKFLKFVHSPNIPHKRRKKPDMIAHFEQLKRKERFVYEAKDMWTREDDLLFIKYCHSSASFFSFRDIAYHMASRDTGARPSELLKIRIRDLAPGTTEKGARFVTLTIGYGGKTGPREVTLTDSLPHVFKWLELHPLRHDENAMLFCSRTGEELDEKSMYTIYREYKKYFTRLSESPLSDVPEEDHLKIKRLVKKPWNPYIQSALNPWNIIGVLI